MSINLVALIIIEVNSHLVNTSTINLLHLRKQTNDSLLVVCQVTNRVAAILALECYLFERGNLLQVLDLWEIADVVIIQVNDLQVWCLLSILHDVLEVLESCNSVMAQIQPHQAFYHVLQTLNLSDFVATQVKITQLV